MVDLIVMYPDSGDDHPRVTPDKYGCHTMASICHLTGRATSSELVERRIVNGLKTSASRPDFGG